MRARRLRCLHVTAAESAARRLRAGVVAVTVVALALLPAADARDHRAPAKERTSTQAPAAPTAPPRLAPVPKYGFNMNSLLAGPLPTVPIDSARLWDTGTAQSNTDLTWAQMNPAPGVYDFSLLDSYLQRLASARITDVMLVLQGTPAWAKAAGCRTNTAAEWLRPYSNCPPASLQFWTDFVNALIGHNTARAQAGLLAPTSYQFWNEPTLPGFWASSVRWGLFAQMADVLATAVQSRTTATAVSPPVLPSGGILGRRTNAMLAALERQDIEFDVLAIHAYTPRTHQDWTYLPQKLNGALTRAYRYLPSSRGLPRWITEVNFQNDGHSTVTDPATVQTEVTFAMDYARQAGFARLYWYAWNVHFMARFVPGSPATTAYARKYAAQHAAG